VEQSTVTAFDEVSRTVGDATCVESETAPLEHPTRTAAAPTRRILVLMAVLPAYTAAKGFVPTLALLVP
jgi:hypothetical protein